MEFSSQEFWSGQPFPSPGDLPDLAVKPRSPALQADSLLSEHKRGPDCPVLRTREYLLKKVKVEL